MGDDGDALTIEGVRMTHPDKPLAEGIRKRDLAEHFASVAEWMLPHVVDRPLSLVRCPGGMEDGCFWQKHAGNAAPDALDRISVPERDGEAEYLAVHDRAGLVALAQIAALEVHLMGARRGRLDRADRLVFDLDPGPKVAFDAVAAAAREVRDRLDELGLASFPLLTGGKGVHVVVPLVADRPFEEVRAFAQAVARAMSRDDPERFVAKAAKDVREGRIFVDYLRNGAGTTAIAPYSPRAKPGLPVAVPLRWQELGRRKSAQDYRLGGLGRRLGALDGDPWGEWRTLRQRIGADAMAAVGVEP